MSEYFFHVVRPTADHRSLHVADVLAHGPRAEVAMDRAARHMRGHAAVTAPTLVFETDQVAPGEVEIREGDMLLCGRQCFTVVGQDEGTYQGHAISLRSCGRRAPCKEG